MKKYLLIMQQDPYANSLALEGLELAMAISAFEQPVTLLFRGAGITQLLRAQDSTKIIGKDFTKAYSGLNLFGINDIYVASTDMNKYDLAELITEQTKIVDDLAIEYLIKSHDIIITI